MPDAEAANALLGDLTTAGTVATGRTDLADWARSVRSALPAYRRRRSSLGVVMNFGGAYEICSASALPTVVALVTVVSLGSYLGPLGAAVAGETMSVSGNVSVAASTYYVAPGGRDSNPGTQAAPFATLQKAHSVVGPGDTIYMRGGTYRFSTQTTLTRDGTSGKPIRLFNYPGESPVFDAIGQPGGSARTGVVLLSGASWWHIKGLEIKNGPINGVFCSSKLKQQHLLSGGLVRFREINRSTLGPSRLLSTVRISHR